MYIISQYQIFIASIYMYIQSWLHLQPIQYNELHLHVVYRCDIKYDFYMEWNCTAVIQLWFENGKGLW